MKQLLLQQRHLAKTGAHIFKTPDIKKKYTSARVIQIFLNSDMRCTHVGLRAIAESSGIDIQDLRDGELLVFVNRSQSMVKVLTKYNIMFHLKPVEGSTIDLGCLQYLPKVLQTSGVVDYDAALEQRLKDKVKFFQVYH